MMLNKDLYIYGGSKNSDYYNEGKWTQGTKEIVRSVRAEGEKGGFVITPPSDDGTIVVIVVRKISDGFSRAQVISLARKSGVEDRMFVSQWIKHVLSLDLQKFLKEKDKLVQEVMNYDDSFDVTQGSECFPPEALGALELILKGALSASIRIKNNLDDIVSGIIGSAVVQKKNATVSYGIKGKKSPIKNSPHICIKDYSKGLISKVKNSLDRTSSTLSPLSLIIKRSDTEVIELISPLFEEGVRISEEALNRILHILQKVLYENEGIRLLNEESQDLEELFSLDFRLGLLITSCPRLSWSDGLGLHPVMVRNLFEFWSPEHVDHLLSVDLAILLQSIEILFEEGKAENGVIKFICRLDSDSIREILYQGFKSISPCRNSASSFMNILSQLDCVGVCKMLVRQIGAKDESFISSRIAAWDRVFRDKLCPSWIIEALREFEIRKSTSKESLQSLINLMGQNKAFRLIRRRGPPSTKLVEEILSKLSNPFDLIHRSEGFSKIAEFCFHRSDRSSIGQEFCELAGRHLIGSWGIYRVFCTYRVQILNALELDQVWGMEEDRIEKFLGSFSECPSLFVIENTRLIADKFDENYTISGIILEWKVVPTDSVYAVWIDLLLCLFPDSISITQMIGAMKQGRLASERLEDNVRQEVLKVALQRNSEKRPILMANIDSYLEGEYGSVTDRNELLALKELCVNLDYNGSFPNSVIGSSSVQIEGLKRSGFKNEENGVSRDNRSTNFEKQVTAPLKPDADFGIDQSEWGFVQNEKVRKILEEDWKSPQRCVEQMMAQMDWPRPLVSILSDFELSEPMTDDFTDLVEEICILAYRELFPDQKKKIKKQIGQEISPEMIKRTIKQPYSNNEF